MGQLIDPVKNYEISREKIGYVERRAAKVETYAGLGFKCGLEIHQQLKTEKKLFCRCPAGLYCDGDDYDAEVIRHMRPTLSELGEYDGTALMEFKTKKNVIYRIKDESACTYDIDDTPPFSINREALDIAIEISLLLKTNIVGELHITRKQYLDGSIPTGFQRTAIVGIEGEIPLSRKKVRIIQLNIEEDACREVSDIGHWRTYTTDRLGMPLIETITYPDMLTPDEAAETAHYLRFLVRSTGKVRTGIGAAREDVNVSINGGDRVEIKGVAHIKWIPELVHNEAYRQKSLLAIRDILNSRISDKGVWKINHIELPQNLFRGSYEFINKARREGLRLAAVNLPGFAGIPSFFTQPGQTFAHELSGRLKVIACIEHPNMTHSEMFELSHKDGSGEDLIVTTDDWAVLRKEINSHEDDALIIIRASEEDLNTGLEAIEERCRMAFDGVPNETRKAMPDGTTIFERVLPGPDRMYPDTDSAPIPIEDAEIEEIRKGLPVEIDIRTRQLRHWNIPEDTFCYLLRRNLTWLIEKTATDLDFLPRMVGTLLGHRLRHLETRITPAADFNYYAIYGLFKFIKECGLDPEIAREMLPVLYSHPKMVFDSILTAVGYRRYSEDVIINNIRVLRNKFREIRTSPSPSAAVDWIMGRIRTMALGNIPLSRLRELVDKENSNE